MTTQKQSYKSLANELFTRHWEGATLFLVTCGLLMSIVGVAPIFGSGVILTIVTGIAMQWKYPAVQQNGDGVYVDFMTSVFMVSCFSSFIALIFGFGNSAVFGVLVILSVIGCTIWHVRDEQHKINTNYHHSGAS